MFGEGMIIHRLIKIVGVIALLMVIGLTLVMPAKVAIALNSPASDQQPALSGNGQFLAYVSNRNG